MDINNITLKYLMNPQHYDRHMHEQSEERLKADKLMIEKLNFYKKRIIALTKDMLKNNFPEENLRQSFNQYAKCLIEYFEFVDKKDIIQDDYKVIDALNPVSLQPIQQYSEKDITDAANALMTNTPSETPTTLDNFVIKTPRPPERKIIPTKKMINIKESHLKSKGVKKKKRQKKTKLPKKNKPFNTELHTGTPTLDNSNKS
mgnify:CR=1 FL=1|tara:strand:- start:450 stop:1055 length:606 start_codon:yes stop_codon:yes gene_type:complete